MQGWRSVPIAMALFLAWGCASYSLKQHSTSPSLLHGNPSQVRERLLAHIPIDTPRPEAERIARTLGLELTPQSELGSGAFDSIHCRHSEKKGLFGETVWLIQIDCPDGAVAEIICEQIGISSW